LDRRKIMETVNKPFRGVIFGLAIELFAVLAAFAIWGVWRLIK
jgi:hypothetical protein